MNVSKKNDIFHVQFVHPRRKTVKKEGDVNEHAKERTHMGVNEEVSPF